MVKFSCFISSKIYIYINLVLKLQTDFMLFPLSLNKANFREEYIVLFSLSLHINIVYISDRDTSDFGQN